jgi:gamma-glutamyltranspeptidase/glutathione hydrolase
MSPRREVDSSTLDLHPAKLPWPQRIAASPRGMAATAHPAATEAAVEILSDGGNAIDAAVAAGFAIGVCEPNASGLGGQSMMMLHVGETRKTVALDGSSRAPDRAVPGALSAAERRRGHRATTVPSTPATLAYALETYGTLPLARVLEPAIRIADEGFVVGDLFNRLSRRELKRLKAGSAARFFLKEGTRAHSVGSVLCQPVLAETLRRLAAAGIEDFYNGAIARAIHADMQAHDGLLHADDLARIPWPVERRPISGQFTNLRVLTFPPPAAGRTLIEMMNILSHFPERRWNPDTPDGAALLAEVIRQAFIDRNDRPFDPATYRQFSEENMLSPDYAQDIARSIRKRIKTSGETTHLSVADAQGNFVGLTQSIERVFGSYEASPDLGFLYNDYMSAFDTEDPAHPYHLRPNAVPWASVAPTIVFRGRRPWLVIGSPGSERITSSILQVLVRLQSQSPYDAVAAPRLHCSLGGKVSLEASRMRSDIPDALRRRGFEIDEREPWSFYLGCVQLVAREGKVLVGVADPRRDGSAGGPA